MGVREPIHKILVVSQAKFQEVAEVVPDGMGQVLRFLVVKVVPVESKFLTP